MKIYYKKKFWASVGSLVLGLALPGTCLFVGYSAAGGQVLARLGNGRAPRAVRFLCRTATPLLILLVLLHGLGLI